jgi:replicative DNA helicase
MAEIDQAQQADDVARRVSTGLADVDREPGRIRGGNLVVIGGRASMGKTALALDITENNARDGRRGLFFSMEMTAGELAARRIARTSGVSVKDQGGTLDNTQYHKVVMAVDELKRMNLPLHIDHRPALTLAQIRATARRLHRKHGLSFVVIDYLQIMGDDSAMSGAPRTYQIGKNTAGLKALAKELDIPIFLLAQVNRGVEKQEDKRPGMSDLKDSGSVEQDADIIMFVYRESYYLERSPPIQENREGDADFSDRKIQYDLLLREARGKATIIIAKARQGNAPATADVAFDGSRTTFGNLQRRRES